MLSAPCGSEYGHAFSMTMVIYFRIVSIQYTLKTYVIAASAPQSPVAKRIIPGIAGQAGQARNDEQWVLNSSFA
jgi:hypothetical protein